MITDRNALRATLRELFPRNRGQLLPALHFLQHEFGHLPGWAMEMVGWHLGIPASEVYGAATTYVELRIEKPDRPVLRVCTGLSCWINGGRDIFDEFSVRNNGPASDASVTLEETACAFLCGMAPAVEWDGELVGRATVDSVTRLVRREGSS